MGISNVYKFSEKVNLLQVQKKLTVEDIKRELRNKQNKLQENVEKFKKLHKSVELDPETTQLVSYIPKILPHFVWCLVYLCVHIY